MIIRILGEGQYEVADSDMVELNRFDDALESALADGNEVQLTATLNALLAQVRQLGTHLPDEDDRGDSDLILPAADSTLEELQAALGEDGLLPG